MTILLRSLSPVSQFLWCAGRRGGVIVLRLFELYRCGYCFPFLLCDDLLFGRLRDHWWWLHLLLSSSSSSSFYSVCVCVLFASNGAALNPPLTKTEEKRVLIDSNAPNTETTQRILTRPRYHLEKRELSIRSGTTTLPLQPLLFFAPVLMGNEKW